MKTSIERHTRLIIMSSIAAIFIGVVAVITERVIGKPIFDPINKLLAPISSIWTTLFIVLTVPLVFVLILRAILAIGKSKLLGLIGVYAIGIHFVFVVVGFAIVVGVDHIMLPVLFPDQFSEWGQREAVNGLVTKVSGLTSLINWFDQLRLVAIRLIQPALFSAIILGLTGLLFFKRKCAHHLGLLEKVSTWILEGVFILILFMPIAILSVVFSMFKEYGTGLFMTFAVFIVYQVLFIIVFIALLYLAGYFFASLPPQRLFKAMIPTYFVAASTRSSYACVALATKSANNALQYQKHIIESAIPFFLVTFRANRAITSIMTFEFLAHCFGSDPAPGLLLSYLLFTMLATIGSPGLPGSFRFNTLPFYAAAGIPIETYMFNKIIDDIPDIFKTMLNVTYPVVLLGLVMNLKTRLDNYILKT